MTPDAVGALAAAGIGKVRVRRRPRLHLLPTGSELIAAAGSAKIFDSNTPMIAACAARMNVQLSIGSAVPDERHAQHDAIADAPADLIVSTGGVSAGTRDLLPAVLRQLGAEILFHGAAMRPGKPVLFAVLPDGRLFFGLPGNPVAALVGFRFFVTAAIRRLVGVPFEEGLPVQWQQPRLPEATLFLRGCQRRDPQGDLAVDTALDQRSHILSSVMDADCWIRVDDDEEDARLYEKFGDLRS